MKDLKAFERKYQGKILDDWGCYMSDQAKQFIKDFVSALKNELKAKGDYVVKIKPEHYYMSGFIKKGEKCVWLAYSIPRFNSIHLAEKNMKTFLIRAAKNELDFIGGANNYSNLSCLVQNIISLLQ